MKGKKPAKMLCREPSVGARRQHCATRSHPGAAAPKSFRGRSGFSPLSTRAAVRRAMQVIIFGSSPFARSFAFDRVFLFFRQRNTHNEALFLHARLPRIRLRRYLRNGIRPRVRWDRSPRARQRSFRRKKRHAVFARQHYVYREKAFRAGARGFMFFLRRLPCI